MNLKFWKKKKAPEESGNSAADETLVAKETNPTPAKPGLWARLKGALSPSRKKIKPDVAEEAEPSAKRKDDKPQDEESAALPPKPGFLARLKSALLPSRKKKKTEDEDKPDEAKPSAKHADKKHRDKEPEPSDIPAKKSKKRLVIVLALLIPLAVGGGFFAATKLMPPPQPQKAPQAKDAAMQEVKINGNPTQEPVKAAEQAQQPEPEQPLPEPAPQQADNATTPAAEALAPVDGGVQTQIEELKKQNQEMQAQIEALKKQSERPTRSTASATPREGVLIINGQNAKESAQGLKKAIEGMNADSGAKDTGKR